MTPADDYDAFMWAAKAFAITLLVVMPLVAAFLLWRLS